MSPTLTWLPGMPTTVPQAASIGDASMRVGYELATRTLTDAMQLHAPAQLATWQALSADTSPKVLVVSGTPDQSTYDHMELVLETAKIPYAKVAGSHLLGQALDELERIRAILINCASGFDAVAAQRAARFVEAGGLLVTSDWALKTVLEVGFPGVVRHNGRKTGNEFVGVEIGVPNPLIQALFAAAASPPGWWLEGSSFPIQRLRKDGLTVVLRSRALQGKYGNGSVMVAFPHGAGGVMHMISHAFLQQRRPGQLRGAGAQTASGYTISLGSSRPTIRAYEEAERSVPDFDGDAAATTATSMGIFLDTLLRLNAAQPSDSSAAPVAEPANEAAVASPEHGVDRPPEPAPAGGNSAGLRASLRKLFGRE